MNLTAQPGAGFWGNLYIERRFHTRNRELAFRGGVQRREDARNLTSLRARRWFPEELSRGRRRKKSRRIRSHHSSWRCVMSLDPESVRQQNLGSLQSCLVEGDPEQRARGRRVRRKALLTSVLAQASLLAALILVPLFGRPAHLVMAITTPVPPYHRVAPRTPATPGPHEGTRRVCVVCFDSRPATLTPPSHPESDEPQDPLSNSPVDGIPIARCPSSDCIGVGRAEGPAPPGGEGPRRETKRLVETHI